MLDVDHVLPDTCLRPYMVTAALEEVYFTVHSLPAWF